MTRLMKGLDERDKGPGSGAGSRFADASRSLTSFVKRTL